MRVSSACRTLWCDTDRHTFSKWTNINCHCVKISNEHSILEIRNVELISSRGRTHCNLLAGLVVRCSRPARGRARSKEDPPSLPPSLSCFENVLIYELCNLHTLFLGIASRNLYFNNWKLIKFFLGMQWFKYYVHVLFLANLEVLEMILN